MDIWVKNDLAPGVEDAPRRAKYETHDQAKEAVDKFAYELSLDGYDVDIVAIKGSLIYSTRTERRRNDTELRQETLAYRAENHNGLLSETARVA